MSLPEKPSARAAEHPRATEHRLFADITRGLMAAGALGHGDDAFLAAGGRNERLWAALKTDLESETNWLAVDLKAKLIALADWVERHSKLVVAGQAEVGPLI